MQTVGESLETDFSSNMNHVEIFEEDRQDILVQEGDAQVIDTPPTVSNVNKPFINKVNQEKRKDWCRQYLNWTLEQWRQVMWSDESSFVFTNEGRKRVRNESAQRKILTKMYAWHCEAR
jgi:hypothetical protein